MEAVDNLNSHLENKDYFVRINGGLYKASDTVNREMLL